MSEVQIQPGGYAVPDTTRVAVDQSTIAGDGSELNPLHIVGVPPGQTDLFVNLNAPPYNLTANDPASATRNQIGINKAITDWNGKFARLECGEGNYYFGRLGTTNASIAVKGVSRLVFAGQGQNATRFIQQGDAAFGEWNLWTIDGSSDIDVTGITFEQGTINNSDPRQENHLVSIYNGGGGTKNITFTSVDFGKCIGDAFRVFANNTGDFVENVTINGFYMNLVGVVDPDSGRTGGRSGLSLQRGYRNYQALNGFIENCQNESIDMEPSGDADIVLDGSLFQNITVDGTNTNVDVDISWGGASVGALAVNCRVINCKLKNGAATILSTQGLFVSGFEVESSIAFDVPATPLVTVRQINNNFKLSNLTARRLTGSGAGPVLDIENYGDSTEVLDFDVHQDTIHTAVHFDGCSNARIRGKITDTAGGAGSRDGVEFFAVVGDANFPQILELQVISTNTLQSAIGFYPRQALPLSNSMKNIMVGHVMANNAFYGCFFSYGVGSHPDLNPIMVAVNAGINQAWRAEDQGATPIDTVFPVIGGNIGINGAARYPSPRLLTGNVAPEGACIGNLGDWYSYCPTSTTAQFWVKTAQSVAGVPDNTGWQQITGLT